MLTHLVFKTGDLNAERVEREVKTSMEPFLHSKGARLQTVSDLRGARLSMVIIAEPGSGAVRIVRQCAQNKGAVLLVEQTL